MKSIPIIKIVIFKFLHYVKVNFQVLNPYALHFWNDNVSMLQLLNKYILLRFFRQIFFIPKYKILEIFFIIKFVFTYFVIRLNTSP